MTSNSVVFQFIKDATVIRTLLIEFPKNKVLYFTTETVNWEKL